MGEAEVSKRADALHTSFNPMDYYKTQRPGASWTYTRRGLKGEVGVIQWTKFGGPWFAATNAALEK